MTLLASLVLAQERCAFCKSDAGVSKVNYTAGALPVCAKCQSTLPPCDVCQLPCGEKRYRDGRFLCASCKKTGITSQADALKLYAEVQTFIKGTLGGIAITPWPPVQCVDKDELQTKFSEGGRSMNVGGFYRPYNPEMIYILSYEPRLEAGAVLAHEYTHAWQTRNCPQQDRAVTEGFASWVEYKYLLSKGERAQAEQIKQKNDPDYGAALVKILEQEKKLGSPAKLIEWARTAKKL